MSDYVTFEAAIAPMTWGRATYSILRLPDAVVTALGPTRRVEGELAEHPVNLALMRTPVVEGLFLWAGQSLIDRIGIQPGERLEVRLRPASNDIVALRAQGATDRWQALSPGRQRGMLHPVASARIDATRAKRIAKLVQDVAP